MTPPLVSVVIPTYNGARYIREALASLQQQTLQDWEAIVVDDGSTDDTAAIVREFMATESRLRLVEHRENQSLPVALNTGFAAARGRYLTWSADDNLFRPRALEVMQQYLESHPETGLVYAAATIIDKEGKAVRHRPAADPHDLYERNCVGWCFMYPDRARQAVGDYDPACFLAEDLDYWLRISMHYEVAAITEDLYLYRDHPGSLTGTRPEKCRRAAAEVYLRHVAKLPRASRQEKAQVLYELMSYFKRERLLLNTLRALVGGLTLDPKYFLQRFRHKARPRG